MSDTPPVGALVEGEAEFSLEGGDPPVGRLGYVNPTGGPSEVQLLGNHHEAPQMPEVHPRNNKPRFSLNLELVVDPAAGWRSTTEGRPARSEKNEHDRCRAAGSGGHRAALLRSPWEWHASAAHPRDACDGGQFDELAAVLAESHLVITYDRAGTSRSAGPPAPSVAGHADDAARLVRAHGTEPAVVFGTSNGAAVALELALRHPSLVERAIVHEPPLVSVLADPQPVGEMLGQMIGAAMDRGGPTAALEAFLRFAFGDDVVEGWSGELRDRMLANADMVFSVEFPAFQGYRPDEAALRASKVPFVIAVGVNQAAPFIMEAATWLAERVGVQVERVPGAHGPQFTCPRALVDAVFGG